jgi:hypothetical protein
LHSKAINVLIGSIITACLVSCSYFKQEEQPDAVATLGNAYLTSSEIASILPDGYTSADSTLIVQSYIDNWATAQMLMRNARQNISEELQEELDMLIDRYKTELYTQAYLQELVKTSLDTNISNAAINEYFQERKEEFMLNEDLVKFKYIQLDKSYSQMDYVQTLFQRADLESLKKLDSLSLGYRSYSLNDSIWVKKSTLLERINAITASNENQYVKPGRYWKLDDSLGVYLVRFKDVLRRGQQAPLSYVQPTIKQILRNQRKLAFIKSLEKELLNDAIENNRLKINP